MKRVGQVWIRVFPDKPITLKPAETRMGKGKGAPEYWVAVVKPGPRSCSRSTVLTAALAKEALAPRCGQAAVQDPCRQPGGRVVMKKAHDLRDTAPRGTGSLEREKSEELMNMKIAAQDA